MKKKKKDKEKKTEEVDEKPWRRRKGETEDSWYCFQELLHMERPRRIKKLIEITGKCEASLYQMSTNNGWMERIRAYDNWLSEIQAERIMRGAEDSTLHLIRVMLKGIAIHEKVMEKYTRKMEEMEDEDHVSMQDSVRLLKESMHNLRLLTGKATEILDDKSADLDMSELSDEEMDVIMRIREKGRTDEISE